MAPSIDAPAQTASPRSRWLGMAALAMMLVLATVALPFWAGAMTIRGDDEVRIAAGETITDDLAVAGDRVVLGGNARLDVFVMARDIDINGNVGGSVNATGAEITISGQVDGSVRIFGGSATISGTIGGDLLVFGGSATIETGGVVNGDVTMHGGTLTVDGSIGGEVTGGVERLNLAGSVDGDVAMRTGSLDVAETARLRGGLSYVSASDGDIAAGATIGGQIERDSIAPWGADSSARGRFFSPLVRTLWLLVAGMVIAVLAPRLAIAIDANLRRPLATIVVGLVSLVAVPVIALVLAITIVGIPVSLMLIGLYLAALYLSQYMVGQRLGGLLLPRAWNDGSRGYLLLSMTIGVLVLSVLRYLPVPFVGSVVDGVVAIAGLGAAVLLLRQLRTGYPSGQTALW